MIENIYVDGFRSLVSFRLELRPGLNLLIGPNGSGKTNIIYFLGFLSQLATHNLSALISNLGGSGAVFRKLGANKYQSRIKARIQGRVRPDNSVRYRADQKPRFPSDQVLLFEYGFNMELSDDRETVFFASQNLKLHMVEGRVKARDIEKWDCDIQIHGNPDGTVQCDRAVLSPLYRDELRPHDASDPYDPEKDIERRCSSNTSIMVLAVPLLPTEYAHPLINDFGRGMIFNPHPSHIRVPEDSAKSPGIRPDGSGLYASLFALRRGKTRPDPTYRFLMLRQAREVPFAPSIKIDRLVDYFRLAYPSMLNLTVTNDQFENTIRVRITLDGVAKSQIPLAALSDGTLKWMAFVTAIFTNPNLLAIEEPENFVHPFVQREAVNLAREQIQEDSHILMSSHSETILNAAEPEEVIVVSPRKSRTVARRVRNPDHLRALISKSGFGLGFYYLSGALADA